MAVTLSTLSVQAQKGTNIDVVRHGEIQYELALSMQRAIHEGVVSGVSTNTLLLLEHPSIYTAGKRTLESEKPQDGSRVIEVDRGGKITWHGPGQLVGYPIVKLKNPHELVGFVRTLEAALIDVCAELGVNTQRIDGRSGVWVVDSAGARKIAAIGVRIAQGVSMHGFALNVNPDLSPFESIIPCGISDADVTSLESELDRDITISEVAPLVEKYMRKALAEVIA